MTDEAITPSPFKTITSELRKMVDEVKLKAHLGGMEVKEQLEKLEPKVTKLEQDALAAGDKVNTKITEGLQKAGAEIKEQLEKLRAKLKSD
jgi:hypothetical protein